MIGNPRCTIARGGESRRWVLRILRIRVQVFFVGAVVLADLLSVSFCTLRKSLALKNTD